MHDDEKLYEYYLKQSKLARQCLETVAEFEVFALMGGTAINLFYWELPRLSVDIDLRYMPIRSREFTLPDIERTFIRMGEALVVANPGFSWYLEKRKSHPGMRIWVEDGSVKIKIETSPVMRGSVYPAKWMETSLRAAEVLGKAAIYVISFEDVYAGKILAALSRQHPRDLFDIKILYDHGGITDKLMCMILVFVASVRRPMHEIIPREPFPEHLYDGEFKYMNLIKMSLEDMHIYRERLHRDVRRFLCDPKNLDEGPKTAHP